MWGGGGGGVPLLIELYIIIDGHKQIKDTNTPSISLSVSLCKIASPATARTPNVKTQKCMKFMT